MWFVFMKLYTTWLIMPNQERTLLMLVMLVDKFTCRFKLNYVINDLLEVIFSWFPWLCI